MLVLASITSTTPNPCDLFFPCGRDQEVVHVLPVFCDADGAVLELLGMGEGEHVRTRREAPPPASVIRIGPDAANVDAAHIAAIANALSTTRARFIGRTLPFRRIRYPCGVGR